MSDKLQRVRDWLEEHLDIVVLVGIWVVIGLIIFGILYVSAPRLDEGIVVDKDYSPARLQPYSSTVNGKTSWRTTYFPERHTIKVQGVTEEGEARAEWWDLGEGMYAMVDIGDYVRRDNESISIVRKGENIK